MEGIRDHYRKMLKYKGLCSNVGPDEKNLARNGPLAPELLSQCADESVSVSGQEERIVIRGLFDTLGMATMKKAITGTEKRVAVIANNIANVDTPGYQRQTVSFEKALQSAKRAGAAPSFYERIAGDTWSRIAAAGIQMDVIKTPPIRRDRSNVNIHEEITLLKETQGKNMALKELLTRRYAQMANAIRERIA